jgi:Glyoxalase-like domain
MSNSVVGLSVDCADAAKLAQFWADVLGRAVNPKPTAERHCQT